MFTLSSPTLRDGQPIPMRHLGPGHGDDVAPTLEWQGAPEGTRAYALTLTDDDAPGYQHWLVVLDGGTRRLAAGELPRGAVLGQGTRALGYEGPCPPSGTHHYVFTLHALSAVPDLAPGFDADRLQRATEATGLATATLRGTYTPSRLHAVRSRVGHLASRLRRSDDQA